MGPLDLLCAGRDWDSFLYHCKWTSSLEAERLRGRERSLEHEVQVLIDGKPVRTLARQSANSETNCDSKSGICKTTCLNLPLQAWPFWRAHPLVRGQLFRFAGRIESPLGLAA